MDAIQKSDIGINEVPEALVEKVLMRRNFKRERPAVIVVPGPGQESVWDYPRPPRVEPVSQRVRIELGGIVLADTQGAYRVLETAGAPVYYLPPADVQRQYLVPSTHTTLCEWKGISRYWSVQVGGRLAANAIWSYPAPWSGYEMIQDYLAFYPYLMDACFVGEERVIPQPGHYYGGWITSNITGPFKGLPGTENW
jgi:uncharacterized protein (DUF427 family)